MHRGTCTAGLALALIGLTAVSHAAITCHDLNIDNLGCLCHNNSAACPGSECNGLYCVTRQHCTKLASFCDYPMKCEDGQCSCLPATTPSATYPTKGAFCCSGLAPNPAKKIGQGYCSQPPVCIKDIQCFRLKVVQLPDGKIDFDFRCDSCVGGRCIPSKERDCGFAGGDEVTVRNSINRISIA